ncbi:MAG: response regulator transcription factor [Gemmatimonadetes bacterium]|nr:response regulator transcription factor [Gemmatimonadota bacterium]NNF14745.1 response regulator transcription factor [Gemmatimonadota bacterium]NNL29952.1 response regulator transcription factor [Gemmatimonadota bacterium]
MSGNPMRVVIADDHSVVRQGIRGVLEGVEGLEVVGEAPDGDEALQMVRELHPDVVILDVNMPRKTGLEVTSDLREGGHPVRVLILSMHDDPEYVLQAVRSGADGYVLKDAPPSELREAVVAVHEGREYFTARVTQQLSVGLRQEIEEEQLKARLESLTPRETEVLLHVAEGLTNREIGGKLEISPRTVETHRERVMDKLRIRTVAGLTRFVVENGLDQAQD